MDIIIKDLCKSYIDLKVLDNYNTIIKENKITFIKGASGSGKTTLIRILMGLEKEDNGEIIGIEEKNISAVFQEDSLCENLSVKGNFNLVFENLNDKELEDNLKRLNLNNCINKRVKELSGGMKRRVAILRALMYDFDFLIMDEPFKGLDLDTKKIVIEFVKEKIKNKTVLIITHNIEEIKYFEEVELIKF